MTCCSDRRTATTTPWLRAAASAPPAAPARTSTLRYVGTTPVALRGPSGRIYTVYPGTRDVTIDDADRSVLLKTDLFADS